MSNQWSQIDHVIIPAAGYGTRLLPASKAIPKEMLTIVNKPAIEYIVEEASSSNINTIVLITSKNKDSIVDHFDSNKELEALLEKKKKDEFLSDVVKYNGLNFINIRQTHPLGLGDAVYRGSKTLSKNSFVVILPDMIIKNGSYHLNKMLEMSKKYNKGVIALMEVPKESVSSYGIVDGDKLDDNIIDIKDLVEKPSVESAPSNLAILGRYILPYKTMEILKDGKPDQSGEIQLTDALVKVAKEDGLLGYIVRDEIYDIGSPVGFVKANIAFSLENKKFSEEIEKFIKSYK